jgi:hypothetical protein
MQTITPLMQLIVDDQRRVYMYEYKVIELLFFSSFQNEALYVKGKN